MVSIKGGSVLPGLKQNSKNEKKNMNRAEKKRILT
jgi:hypothetical protein